MTEEDDIFNYGEGEEGDAEEQAATKARRERMAVARQLKEEADRQAGKPKANKSVEKALVVLEIKPWEPDTDLEAVWKMIPAQTQEGLTWGETFKLEPVAFDIKKLVMTATIVDDLVRMDDITDKIEALEDHVQSVEVVSMNKL
jgi:elongation factor 1-beta